MSAESKQQKQAVIDEIKNKLDGAQSAVIVDYMGITVEEADALRKNLREANVDYTVYKNTLIKRAIEGTEFEPLKDDLEGPTALAISKDDATAPARILSKSINDFQKMAFKAGIVEGKYYDKDGIEVISKIPSREELIAKFLGSIKSPVSKFARTLAAIAEKKESEPEAAPAAEAAPAEEAPAAEAAPAEAAPAAEAAPEEKPAE